MSMDGYIAGPNGEMDWMQWNWDDALKTYVTDLTETVDTILLGRKMADGFITHWTKMSSRPDDESYEFANKMVDYPKVVFTKTLNECPWANTVLAKGDLTEEVNAIKNQPGKDIIVYGGASFDGSLIKEGLIDELHLFVNPSAIGKGMAIFNSIDDKKKYNLVKATPFECGIVVLQYKPLFAQSEAG